MNIDQALDKEQNKLIQTAKTKGISKDFGRKEVEKLKKKFINPRICSEEMNKNRRLIQLFKDWCGNYANANRDL